MEKKIEKNSDAGSTTNNWKGILQGFVANIVARASDNISEKIQKWLSNIKRITAGIFLMILGSLLALIGLIIYINTIINNGSQWAGYALVGIFLLLLGYIMSRNN